MQSPDSPQTRARPGRLARSAFLWGLVGGLVDTTLFLLLGIDFQMAGRDVTLPVALYLGLNFALLFGAIGWFVEAKTRAQRDAETIRSQHEALEASRKEAAQNEKLAAIGRLAAGVAHEVRNPLGVIRASASMVQESFERGSESHRACDFICEEIDRLNGIIAALLDFARPATPKLCRVSASSVLERALSLETGDLERRGIVVRREFGAAPDFLADPNLVAQVFLGLLTNAAEAVARNGAIELRAEAGEGTARFEVADSGPGISQEKAKRIFEPFYTTKDTGTGLGLAMTARIVDAHGGRIQVLQGRGAGPGGRGACFRVELPLEGPRTEVAA
jgi:two-component system sensor histidine kinase HydH